MASGGGIYTPMKRISRLTVGTVQESCRQRGSVSKALMDRQGSVNSQDYVKAVSGEGKGAR